MVGMHNAIAPTTGFWHSALAQKLSHRRVVRQHQQPSFAAAGAGFPGYRAGVRKCGGSVVGAVMGGLLAADICGQAIYHSSVSVGVPDRPCCFANARGVGRQPTCHRAAGHKHAAGYPGPRDHDYSPRRMLNSWKSRTGKGTTNVQ